MMTVAEQRELGVIKSRYLKKLDRKIEKSALRLVEKHKTLPESI